MKSLVDRLNEVVGPPVEVTEEVLAACQRSNRFGPLVYDLYKEATSLIVFSSGFRALDGQEWNRFGRNQAICVGLLVRIYKLMLSVAKLSVGEEHGETAQILNRCVLESCVNLRYLLLKSDDGEIYDQFVRASLRHERDIYEEIITRIKERGGKQFDVERGMLRSITETCERSGLTLDQIDHGPGTWGGGFRNRFEAIDLGDLYASLQTSPSHAVHGDWVDLLKNHLRPKENEFEANFIWTKTDGDLLGVIAFFAIETTQQFLEKYFSHPDTRPLHQRLADLKGRIEKVEFSRKVWQEVEWA